MKNRKMIYMVVLALLISAEVYSVTYSGIKRAETPPSYTMCSSSSMSGQGMSYQGDMALPGAAAPMYVGAASGDMNPFGVSGPSGAPAGPMKAPPGGTGGDKDNPDVEGPIGDAVLPLMLMALAFAAFQYVQKRRKKTLFAKSVNNR